MAKVYPNNSSLGDDLVIRDLVAVGGQGITYRAERIDTGEIVFLKQLNADTKTAAGKKALHRFKREQSIKLCSQHIPRMLGFFEHEGNYFLISEFIYGESLEDKLNKRTEPFDTHETKDLILQVSQGLMDAHGKGIVHRDIKPANFMVDLAGNIKIVDFGLSRIEGKDSIVETLGPKGTVHYMSPEHISGMGIDGSSDLFSLGTTVYLCATLSFPFDGEDEEKIFRSILKKDPLPPVSINPTLDPNLSDIILKLLRKDKTKRYKNCEALLKDLNNPAGPVSGSFCKCGALLPEDARFCRNCGCSMLPASEPYAGVLQVLNGSRSGTMLIVQPDGRDLGRPDVDPDNFYLSRQHAKVFFADGSYWIQTLGSLNPTAVNSREIPSGEKVQIYPGDHIRMADTICEFKS